MAKRVTKEKLPISAAMRLLEIPPDKRPSPPSGSTKEEIETYLAQWRSEVVKPAYRKQARKYHPDTAEDGIGDQARLNAAGIARDRLIGLRLKPKNGNSKKRDHENQPKTGLWSKCWYCSIQKATEDDTFCYACGARHLHVVEETECADCEEDRIPAHARFCVYCGYDYRSAGILIDLCYTHGLSVKAAHELMEAGTLVEWSALGPQEFNSKVMHAAMMESLNARSNFTTKQSTAY